MSGKQKVLVSIDVESPIGVNGVEKLIYGKTIDGEYGINKIMDILDKYHIKGLFFVDIAEAWEYGENQIKQVMCDIEKRGHNVGVHLHPDRMADKNRKYLWQYSYEEQYELIKKVTEFYVDTLGHYPISFRAGRYGANNETIDILKELEYKIDMSMYYGMKKRCKIDGEYQTINKVKNINNICEIPVTVFKSFDMFNYRRFDKIDESMPFSEFKYVLKKIEQEKSVDVISFFMHSFSILDWRVNPDNPEYSQRNYKRIIKMIQFCKDNGYNFIGEEDCILNKVKYYCENKELCTNNNIGSIFYSFVRAYKIIKEKLIRNI